MSDYATSPADVSPPNRASIAGPLAEARGRLSEIVDEVSTTGSDYIITKRGRPTAVLMGYDEYESLIETLNIMSDESTMSALAEAEAELAAGELVDLD